LPVWLLFIGLLLLGCLFYPVLHIFFVIFHFNELVQEEKKHGDVNYFPILLLFVIYLVYVVPMTLFFWFFMPGSILIEALRICTLYLCGGNYHRNKKHQASVYRGASLVLTLIQHWNGKHDALTHQAHRAFFLMFPPSSSTSSASSTKPTKVTENTTTTTTTTTIITTIMDTVVKEHHHPHISPSPSFKLWTLSDYIQEKQNQRNYKKHKHHHTKHTDTTKTTTTTTPNTNTKPSTTRKRSRMKRASEYISVRIQPAQTFFSEVVELISQILLIPFYKAILSFFYDCIYCVSNGNFLDVLARDLRKNLT
jgi:hypothetical protein